jgi:hypothetical protein
VGEAFKGERRKGTYLDQEIAYAVALAYAIKGDVNIAKQKLLALQNYPYYKNSDRTKFLDGVIAYREGKFVEASEKLARAQSVHEARFYYARTLAILGRPLMRWQFTKGSLRIIPGHRRRHS